MSQQNQTVRGVVLPGQPVFDKICALWILLYATGQSLQDFVLEFCPKQTPSDEDYRRWERSGMVVVDVGKFSYHQTGHASAARRVAEMLFVIHDPTIAHLVALCDENNRKAILKNMGKKSVTYLLREMHKLGYEPAVVVEEVLKVIDSWVAVRGKGVVDDKVMSESVMLKGMINRQDGEYRQFTVGGYLRDLDLLKADLATLVAASQKWERIQEQVEAGLALVQAEADKILVSPETVRFMDGKGIQFLSNDDRIAREFIRRGTFEVVMAVTDNGRVAIQTSGRGLTDMKSVAAEFVRRGEKDVWFFDPRLGTKGALLNGSRSQHDAKPTAIPLAEIREILTKAMVIA